MLSMGSMCFLVGPVRQCKNLFGSRRAVPSAVYLTMMVATLVVAFTSVTATTFPPRPCVMIVLQDRLHRGRRFLHTCEMQHDLNSILFFRLMSICLTAGTFASGACGSDHVLLGPPDVGTGMVSEPFYSYSRLKSTVSYPAPIRCDLLVQHVQVCCKLHPFRPVCVFQNNQKVLLWSVRCVRNKWYRLGHDKQGDAVEGISTFPLQMRSLPQSPSLQDQSPFFQENPSSRAAGL